MFSRINRRPLRSAPSVSPRSVLQDEWHRRNDGLQLLCLLRWTEGRANTQDKCLTRHALLKAPMNERQERLMTHRTLNSSFDDQSCSTLARRRQSTLCRSLSTTTPGGDSFDGAEGALMVSTKKRPVPPDGAKNDQGAQACSSADSFDGVSGCIDALREGGALPEVCTCFNRVQRGGSSCDMQYTNTSAGSAIPT